MVYHISPSVGDVIGVENGSNLNCDLLAVPAYNNNLDVFGATPPIAIF